MEDVRSNNIPPPLPPKTRKGGAKPLQQQMVKNITTTVNGGGVTACTSFPEMRSVNLVSAGQKHIAAAQSGSSGDHVVKIRITPGDVSDADYSALPTSDSCIRISVGDDMVRRGGVGTATQHKNNNNSPYFFYNSYSCQANSRIISSGQSSPSDTLDSGTCSDLDGSTPPPLPKKSSTSSLVTSTATVTVTVNGNHHHHRRTGSLTSSGAEVDSDDDVGSNISCDSLNGHELNGDGHELNGDGPELNGNGHGHNGNDHEHNGDVHEAKNSNVMHKTLFNSILRAEKMTMMDIRRSKSPPPPPMINLLKSNGPSSANGFMPQGLLQDIRDRSAKLAVVPATNSKRTWRDESLAKREVSRPNSTTPEPKEIYQKQPSTLYRLQQHSLFEEVPVHGNKKGLVEERTYEEREEESRQRSEAASPDSAATNSIGGRYAYEDDRFYQFHLNEREPEPQQEEPRASETAAAGDEDEETFAGLRELVGPDGKNATIRSARGTVRGVRNRVRAGIATFLQGPHTKSYKEKDSGKVVLYTTTMGVVRQTFQECLMAKKILRTLLVKYEERDVFMSRELQSEVRERMCSDCILVPQLFVDGQHIGDGETIERLNESGELRRLLKPFKSPDACHTCPVCGGFRLLPCSVCNGSKKSVHRNDFTLEFVSLKCMHCDEVGLVRCYAC